MRFILLAFGILIATFFISKYFRLNEGFAVPNGRCGVDQPPCPAGTRCMNGYCLRDEPPAQPHTTDFIILPQTTRKKLPSIRDEMARSTPPYTLMGLAAVFLLLLVALPIAKSFTETYTGGFSSGSSTLTCKDYAKPCPEGYFCQQEKCTSIFPRV